MGCAGSPLEEDPGDAERRVAAGFGHERVVAPHDLVALGSDVPVLRPSPSKQPERGGGNLDAAWNRPPDLLAETPATADELR